MYVHTFKRMAGDRVTINLVDSRPNTVGLESAPEIVRHDAAILFPAGNPRPPASGLQSIRGAFVPADRLAAIGEDEIVVDMPRQVVQDLLDMVIDRYVFRGLLLCGLCG